MLYLAYLKKTYPMAKTILGGPIVSSYYMAGRLGALEDFDHLFLGDEETATKELVEDFLNNRSLPKLIHNTQKFSLGLARAMDHETIRQIYSDFYGAVVEVSCGCPFLCEFCDIRPTIRT